MSATTATSARQPRRPRVATPERWAAALARARANRLTLFVLGGDARFWAVSSSSKPGVAYTVSVVPGQPVNCICEAGRAGDPVCQHKAAVLDRLGMLPRPPAPAATPSGQDGHMVPAPFTPRIIEHPKSPAVRAALAAIYGDDPAA